MLPALTTKIQTLLNRTLHRILGLGKHARSVCIAPVLREFGLPLYNPCLRLRTTGPHMLQGPHHGHLLLSSP